MSPPQEQDPSQSTGEGPSRTTDEGPSTNSLDRLPGRIVAGNFRIDRLIGQGAMGNVYKAEQLSLGKAVAVKVLHAHLMDDEKLVGRFKREAKSASKLNHPNSIQIIDSGQDQDGTLYIAMELLDGPDLAQVIRDDFPLPLPRVVRIMTQVMSALDEAHAQGVIHRDLKPSNIMLIERRGEKDFVKVCDFGIAKATTADGKDDDRQQMLTIQGLVCGTPEYMSPEQARAEVLDGRADLYSAAIILYQLVTGDIPYKADSPMGIVSRHLAETPMRPSARRPDLPIPKSVDDIILRGMEKDRYKRYGTALEFRAALESIVSSVPGQYTPFPPGIQASVPTTNALGSVGPGETAMIPPMSAAQKFGSTADLTSDHSRKGKRGAGVGLAVLVVALFVGAGAAAFIVTRPRTAQPGVAIAASTPAPLPVVAAPSNPPPASAPEPVAPPPAAAPPAAEEAAAPAAPAAHVAAAASSAKHRHHAAAPNGRSPALAPSAEPPASTAVRVPVAAASVTPPPEAAPAPRGGREALGEAEKLLSQGEVADACARGEEAKRMSPKLPAIYKFLGKCYMRDGHAAQANDNYKKYLELSPAASDAPFIKSMIK